MIKYHFIMPISKVWFFQYHVWMWELDHKENWALKNWCFGTAVLENTYDSPLDSKEIKPVNPKGNPPWIFIGRTDAEAEAPILWPPTSEELTHWKRLWCWGRLRAGGEGGDRGWEFKQTPGDSEGQGSWCVAVHGVTKSWTQLSDGTRLVCGIEVLSVSCCRCYCHLLLIFYWSVIALQCCVILCCTTTWIGCMYT